MNSTCPRDRLKSYGLNGVGRISSLRELDMLHDFGQLTRFSFIAGLSTPRMSFWEAEVKSASPAIGRYS